MKWMLLAIALLMGGWLIFDGMRALTVGDYVTPRSGPNAGQLGLWSRVVSAAGLAPRGAFIKLAHVTLGLAWLGASIAFYLRPASGWSALLVTSLCTLWYLPLGTVLSLVALGLLCLPCLRNLK